MVIWSHDMRKRLLTAVGVACMLATIGLRGHAVGDTIIGTPGPDTG